MASATWVRVSDIGGLLGVTTKPFSSFMVPEGSPGVWVESAKSVQADPGLLGRVEEEGTRLMPVDQRLGLGDVGRLARRQEELDRVAEGVDQDVDLGAESAPGTAEGLAPLPPFFPAACWCARTTVLSMIIHSRSGSCSASKTRCHTPFLAQRSNRFQTEPQGPNRSGRSRQGAPVLAIQRTALTNRRLSLAVTPGSPAWPGRRSLMRSQWSSVISWRRIINAPAGHEGVRNFAYPA